MVAKVTKAIALQWLADVPPDKQFWCTDGRILKNLAELGVALPVMSPGTFSGHANELKNDFSNWVRDVIGDEMLARSLSGFRTQAEAAEAVAERVASLKRKAGLK